MNIFRTCCCFILITCILQTTAVAQSKGKNQPTSIVALDAQARNAQEGFVQSMVDLSRSYHDAGQLEKAKALLEAVLRVNQDLPAVKKMVEEINENLLSANEANFEMDTSRGWIGPVARVAKGQTFRVRATGTYKFIANVSLGPDGFPKTDTPNDVAASVPLGALMGMIVIPTEANKNNKPNIKTGKPIAIGQGENVTPHEDGLLFLRMNVPPGTDCKGSLKIELSGYVRSM